MINLTENEVAEIKTDQLTQRAAAIRDAVVTKSVTAQMVGSLFADLIACCGNVRDALALFLGTNLTEITTDIDSRLSGVDAATMAAAAETQKSEQTRAMVESLVNLLSSQNVSAPTKMVVSYAPYTVTLGNMQHPQIKAQALPSFGLGSVLFISDNKALAITPDGKITPLTEGTSLVNVVATVDTKIYQSLTIAVVPPRMRMADGCIRLDGNGNIRLT